MAPRLKLFEWSDGFHVFTVAASSRPKALAAWGSSQDLFATALAKEVDDSPDSAAARASPGTVVARKIKVKLPAAARNKGGAKKARPPSAADRKRVDEVQRALDDLDATHDEAARRLDDELQALRARRDEQHASYEAERERLQSRLEKVRAKLLAPSSSAG
ncbi:hypothetical protein [Brevundimonas diminuta]|uniref:hypothetical protein n=1 Tax=Brevundimonas diminuta TaxID=293 RepID=UPI003CFFDDEF